MGLTEGRVVVVGAGHAGGRLAENLRSGAPALDIVLLGEEEHPPYERPPLSKAVLTGKSEFSSTFLKPLGYYRDNRIDIRLGTRATAIDAPNRRVLTEGAGEIAYDHLVLATGARPRRLPVPGAEGPGVYYLRGIADSLALRGELQPGRRVVVVGAGLIGLEIASSATGLGCAVTVLEGAERPMARILTPALSEHFARLHLNGGVDLRCGVGVSQVERRNGAMTVVLADGAPIPADIVVVGIGAIPNDELAREAGLAVQDGVLADEYGLTSDAGISAAGDVTRHFSPLLGRHVRLESWQNAQNQAIAVARNLTGERAPYGEIPWCWSDQFGTNLQLLGQAEGAERTFVRGDPASGKFTTFYTTAGLITGVAAVNNARDIGIARRLMQRGEDLSGLDLSDPALDMAQLVRRKAA